MFSERQEERCITFLIDAPTSLLIGYAFGLVAARAGPRGRLWAWNFAVLSQTLFVAAVAYFYRGWPDWMWMYVVDPAKPPAALFGLLLFVDYVAAFAAGFYAPRLAGFGTKGHIAAIGAIVGLQLFLVAVTWDRYRTVSTYAAWSVRGEPLWTSTLGTTLTAVFAAEAMVIFGLWLLSRKLASR